MKLIPYKNIEPLKIQSPAAKAVSARLAIGKADGAARFCMRIFEIGPGGYSPKHRHDWEHEIFFHAGHGEVLLGGERREVLAGHVAFIAGGEEHQIRNTGETDLTFVCLIPAGPPEI